MNRAPMDATNGQAEPEILTTHLWEGIGIALDPGADRIFVTDLGGNVHVADLDGSNWREVLLVQGNLTGIAYAEVLARTHGYKPAEVDAPTFEDEGSPWP